MAREADAYRGSALAITLGIALAMALAGCSASNPPPVAAGYSARSATHTVMRGETLYGIARRYSVSVAALMRANGIENARRLRAGQRLVIPGRYRPAVVGRAHQYHPGVSRPPAPAHSFMWPVAGGVVSSGFGIRHGVMHDGIDIAEPTGTPVRAADSGRVVYSGWLRGYGNVIIIQHHDHFATVYGHDYVNEVHAGQRVVRGQVIGEVGATGRATGPNLHFEIRYDNLAYNPFDFLPGTAPPRALSFAREGGS